MSDNPNRIGLDEAARIFKISIGQARNYIDVGIIEAVDRIGMKYLFDKKEVESAKKFLDANRLKKNLKQMGNDLKRVRKRTKK